jgi:hypothetical protein
VASSVELWTVQYSIAYWMFSIITLFLLFNNLKKIIKNRFILIFFYFQHLLIHLIYSVGSAKNCLNFE